jgi:hypothetical protein
MPRAGISNAIAHGMTTSGEAALRQADRHGPGRRDAKERLG